MSCKSGFRRGDVSLFNAHLTKIITILFVLFCCSLFCAYGAGEVPLWVSVPPQEEGKIFNIGFSGVRNISVAKKEATAQGRSLLCGKIAKAIEPYLAPVQDEDFAYYEEHEDAFSFLFLQMIISKVNTEQVYRDENGNTYVLVSIKASDVESQYLNLIQKRINRVDSLISQTEDKRADLLKKLGVNFENEQDEQIEEIKHIVNEKVEKVITRLLIVRNEYESRMETDIIGLL